MTPDDTAPATAEEPPHPDAGPGAPPPDPRAGAASAAHRSPDVVAAVAAGGALGAAARYGAGLVWPTAATAFPWTTFTVNVLGCLVIGCLLAAVTEIRSAHRLLRPFLGTGVLGGFTTFSTYCVDAERLTGDGHALTALAYLAATLLSALAAVTCGALGTRRVLRHRRTS